MTRVAVAVCLAVASVACGPTVSIYNRTSPRRVEVSKQTANAAMRYRAARTADGAVELVAKRSSDVRLTRVVHYNATRIDYDNTYNPFLELVEMVIGIEMLVMPTVFWDNLNFGRETDSRKVVWHSRWMFAMANPLRGGMFLHTSVHPSVPENVFKAQPVVREYVVRLPAASFEVSYRALDDGGAEVARGAVTTNLYGRASIAAVPPTAIALELSAAGETAVIVIDGGAEPRE